MVGLGLQQIQMAINTPNMGWFLKFLLLVLVDIFVYKCNVNFYYFSHYFMKWSIPNLKWEKYLCTNGLKISYQRWKRWLRKKMTTHPSYFGLLHDLGRSFLSNGRNKKIADQEQGTKPLTRGMQVLQAKSMYLGTWCCGKFRYFQFEGSPI